MFCAPQVDARGSTMDGVESRVSQARALLLSSGAKPAFPKRHEAVALLEEARAVLRVRVDSGIGPGGTATAERLLEEVGGLLERSLTALAADPYECLGLAHQLDATPNGVKKAYRRLGELLRRTLPCLAHHRTDTIRRDGRARQP